MTILTLATSREKTTNDMGATYKFTTTDRSCYGMYQCLDQFSFYYTQIINLNICSTLGPDQPHIHIISYVI